MYCEKCNKYFDKDAKFCDVCGEQLIEKETREHKHLQKNSKKKKKKTGLIITLIILGIVLIFGSTAFFVVSLVKFIDTMGTIEYIELGNEKIPTIYMIDNNIQIDDYNK